MPERRPNCTILGGPNGAGKSSIYEALAPDNPEAVSLAAGRRVLGQLDALIAAREDFIYETTLSGYQPWQSYGGPDKRDTKPVSFLLSLQTSISISIVLRRGSRVADMTYRSDHPASLR